MTITRQTETIIGEAVQESPLQRALTNLRDAEEHYAALQRTLAGAGQGGSRSRIVRDLSAAMDRSATALGEVTRAALMWARREANP